MAPLSYETFNFKLDQIWETSPGRAHARKIARAAPLGEFVKKKVQVPERKNVHLVLFGTAAQISSRAILTLSLPLAIILTQ